MVIIGQDNRTEITEVTNLDQNPLGSVVAIDGFQTGGEGSGILISPYHILTAAHVLESDNAARITLAKDVPGLPIRTTTLFPISDANANRSNGGALGGDSRYNGEAEDGYDVGLITLSNGESFSDSSKYIGLLAFVDPKDAMDYTVTTAGYPAVVRNADVDISKNAQYILRNENGDPLRPTSLSEPFDSAETAAQVLFSATGTIDEVLDNGNLRFSDSIDIERGQSGSGVWTTLEGDEPRVLGVISRQELGLSRVGIPLLRKNFAASIDTDFYVHFVENMKNRLGDDSGNDLPENAIVGSDENDEIEGSYRRERILGNEGQDTILGGDADDRLEGGAGYDILKGGKGNDSLQGDGANDSLDGGEGDTDVAVFSDKFENYEYSELTGSTFGVPEQGLITIEHVDGTYADGNDTLVGVEFGIFNGQPQQPLGGTNSATKNSIESATTRIIPLPLEDGVEKTEVVEVTGNTYNLRSYKLPTKASVSLTAPVDMLDGDIDYTLDISPYDPNSEYNIVYIVDTSQSMSGGKLQAVKNAYTDLINSHIDSGLADNGNFGVVEFSTNATSYSNLTPEEAISTINGLTTDTNPGTVYDGGLSDGLNFLGESSSSIDALLDANNIAYFVSGDISNKVTRSCFFGFCTTQNDYNSYFDEAERLKDYAEVRAFGFDDASPLQIDDVDSDDGTMLSSASGLSTELLKSGLRGEVESVNILLDGEVIDTLTPDQFTNNPAGLTYEGTVDNLDVSIDAENIVTAEVIFTPESNFATTTVEHTVTAGQGEVLDQNRNPINESGNEDVDPFERERIGSDGDDDIILGNVDRGASGGAGGDYIVGNRRDNILDGGAGDDTIFGHEGNDTIITGTGINKVDGGEDLDTVLYSDVSYQGNSSLSFSQTGSTLIYSDGNNYPHTDYLTDVEYLQFSDVRLDASTLEITPTIAEISDVSLIEGETASFTFNLDYSAPTDITFDYATQDIDAVALSDYTASSGQITIPAGETTATIDISTIEDTVYDEGTETFSLNLTNLTGATFSNNETELSLTAYIEDRDEPLNLTGTNKDDVLTGGDENDSLKGGAGNDYLYGNAGNDTLRGENGDDFVNGGEGDDSLFGNAGNDTVIGGDGYDRIVEISNGNFILSDTQLNANGIDTISEIEMVNLTGGNTDNLINASAVTAIDTIIKSQAGNDTIRGGAVRDIIDAGADDDIVLAYGGNDNIKGGAGNDSLNGGTGDDTIVASAGDDTIVGGSGIDLLIESGDNDFTLTNSSLIGNGSDSLTAIQQVNLTGGNSNNVIDASGTTSINKTILTGGGGDDTLMGGAKQDSLIGEAGNDLLEGGDLRDILYGGADNDILMGMSGNDVLRGEAGDDTLHGGAETDVLSGGAGADVFGVEVTTGRDVVLDFEDGTDRFSLGSDLSFDDLRIIGNAAGTVAAIRLESNDQLLTVVKNVSYSDLSEADFV